MKFEHPGIRLANRKAFKPYVHVEDDGTVLITLCNPETVLLNPKSHRYIKTYVKVKPKLLTPTFEITYEGLEHISGMPATAELKNGEVEVCLTSHLGILMVVTRGFELARIRLTPRR